MTPTKRTDSATRVAVLALRSRAGGRTTREVAESLSIPVRTVDEILRRAKDRGFDPTNPLLTILPEYYEDAPRSGRPKKRTEPTAEDVVSKVC
ncbi:uncharacterized protein ColSpa_10022 [Colletotrichum spaethianum]|uniref:Uncharacterized protein n=1 Tax=Colletotrichum spaethianum TaxID=700344 RepID=A0AA37PCS6_9PEZI|nr:uncharacterized protein ColSpa_10022 [Colletotrichum spaethianum]GKT49841.1 hypothetical protein ColSpa_10022 [Colletotrichum spaethianum]